MFNFKLIDEAEVVFFDVFDTSIFRRVDEPKELFNLLGKGFKFSRVVAESNAAMADPNTDLRFIYFNGKLPIEIMEKEIELEYQLCYQNPEIHFLYEYAIKQGKKVGFISDMYLSAPVLVKMLEKCGYSHFDFFFVSTDYKARKITGDLYDKVISTTGISPDKMLMIGDNKHSDYNMALSKGLNAHYYERNITDKDFWYRLGYNQVAPSVWSYILWLKEQLRENNIKTVYFLSREGLLYKEVYDLLKEPDDPESIYLYMSRKTVHFPLIANVSEKDFFENPDYYYILWYMTNLSSETAKSFFDYWGLDYRDYLHEMEWEKVDINQDLSELELDKRVSIIRRLTKIAYKDLSEVQAVKAKQRSIKYFKSMIKPAEKMAIVDIGWNGSLQESLSKLLKEIYPDNTPEMSGFYYGSLSRMDERKPFYDMHVFQDKTDLMLNNYMILEFLMGAEHGSVMDYDDENNPVFNNDVKVQHRYLHEGVLDFIKDTKYMNFENPTNYGLLRLGRLFNNPTLEEATKIGDLSNYDGSDKAKIFIAKPDLSFIRRQYDKALNKPMFAIRLRSEVSNINL